MTTYYATPAQVASLLQTTTFSSSTKPTETQVETIINRKEDEIDNRTGHAWREASVSNEYHDIKFDYQRDTGIPIFLNHRSVRTLTSGTDTLEIWTGSEWEEWVANKTEGRNDDYWVDYENGIVYLLTHYWRKKKAVRVSYRYGESAVDGDIEEACAKMAAIDVLTSEDWSVRLPEGTTGTPYSSRISQWKEDIDRIINNRSEINL